MTSPTQRTPSLLAREPVRVVYVLVGFVQAVVTVLLATEAFPTEAAAIVTGITTALYAAVSELFVRHDVTPTVSLPPSPSTPPPDIEPGE
jgi:hypothetical protein